MTLTWNGSDDSDLDTDLTFDNLHYDTTLSLMPYMKNIISRRGIWNVNMNVLAHELSVHTFFQK